MQTLYSMVGPRVATPPSRQLLATQRNPAAALSMPTTTDVDLNPTEEQERFCQEHSAQQAPPAFLTIPWVASEDSRDGNNSSKPTTTVKLLPTVRSRFLAGGTLAVSEPYSMYVYGGSDIVSGHIAAHGSWEAGMTAEMVTRLAEVAKASAGAAWEMFIERQEQGSMQGTTMQGKPMHAATMMRARLGWHI